MKKLVSLQFYSLINSNITLSIVHTSNGPLFFFFSSKITFNLSLVSTETLIDVFFSIQQIYVGYITFAIKKDPNTNERIFYNLE